MSMIIDNGGILTTVQDGGRYGFQQYGVYPSGPMDERAFRIANILTGNDPDEACLEITISGPRIRFTEPAVIALTGGNFEPGLNGKPFTMYRAVLVNSGDTLNLGFAKTGCRGYLSVSGGMNIPELMGSKSSLIKYGVGGYKGRKLNAGDEILLNGTKAALPNLSARFVPVERIDSGIRKIRVILGPQDEAFTEHGIQTFLGNVYTVNPVSDRMGYRMDGPKIEQKTDGNIISDGIVMGSVQVPTSGEPIIMMADHQTVGGYTKIASVISVDLPVVGQMKPGDRAQFVPVSVDEAQELYVKYRSELQNIKEKMLKPMVFKEAKFFVINVNGKQFSVKVEEAEDV